MDARQRQSLETGTGITWEKWLEFLEPYRELGHTHMAALVLRHIQKVGSSQSPQWWAQGITVAYEQHIGRREVGQRSDGSYSATISRVMPAEMDDVLQALDTYLADCSVYAGVPSEGGGRVSRTEKWRYWKISLADGSRVSINIQTKSPGKSSLAVNHDKIPQRDDVEKVKTWWKDLLTQFTLSLR